MKSLLAAIADNFTSLESIHQPLQQSRHSEYSVIIGQKRKYFNHTTYLGAIILEVGRGYENILFL
jgi:hypothetical protein